MSDFWVRTKKERNDDNCCNLSAATRRRKNQEQTITYSNKRRRIEETQNLGGKKKKNKKWTGWLGPGRFFLCVCTPTWTFRNWPVVFLEIFVNIFFYFLFNIIIIICCHQQQQQRIKNDSGFKVALNMLAGKRPVSPIITRKYPVYKCPSLSLFFVSLKWPKWIKTGVSGKKTNKQNSHTKNLLLYI